MSRSLQQPTCVPNLKNLSWFMRPWLKKWVWPTLGCILGQNDPIVMQLKLNMSCHLLNVYTKFQIVISKHVEEKSGKRGRTEGQTGGRTLPRHNTSRFFKQAYKKVSQTDGQTDIQTDRQTEIVILKAAWSQLKTFGIYSAGFDEQLTSIRSDSV